MIFYLNYFRTVIYSYDRKKAIGPVFSVTWSFRNHSKILNIVNVTDYLRKPWYTAIQGIFNKCNVYFYSANADIDQNW